MAGIPIGLWDVVKDTVNFFKRRRVKKIPVGQFIKQIEGRLKMKLSRESKEKILHDLEQEGTIKLVKSRSGKMYVILGDLI